MLAVTFLEGVASQPGIGVNREIVMSPDTCPVHHRWCCTLTWDRAVSFSAFSVATNLLVICSTVQDLTVVFVDVALQVRHTSVTVYIYTLVSSYYDYMLPIYTDFFGKSEHIDTRVPIPE